MFNFKKVFFKDFNLTQLQENIIDALSQVDSILAAGTEVSASLSIGDNSIEHKLGRQPRGWIVVDKTGNANIYRVSWDKLYIKLNSSADVDVTIYIY